MNTSKRKLAGHILFVGILFAALAVTGTAQVQTNTTTAHGQPTKKVTVERGEVVSVEGNDLFVRMEDGQIRHFSNIPSTARVTVDGQELGIHDLKPGMKLERTTVETSTPKVVTTTETVTGKVFHVSPPKTLILTLENGKNQEFTVPDGQKFMVDGEQKDVFSLRKGMTVSATKITETPETAFEKQTHVAGTMPPAPALPADTPVIVVMVPVPRSAPPPAQEAAQPEPQAQQPESQPQQKALPQTASPLPLVGLLGILLLTVSALVIKARMR
jgi:hypothetical protein